jgi:hypothetical protein
MVALSGRLDGGADIDPINFDPIKSPSVFSSSVQKCLNCFRVMNPRVREGWLLPAVTGTARTKPMEQVRTWRLMLPAFAATSS